MRGISRAFGNAGEDFSGIRQADRGEHVVIAFWGALLGAQNNVKP
jgi:hypothetical protein